MIRTLSLLSLAAVLAACAGAPASSGAPRPKPAGENAPLPISAYVDSAGLHQALLTAPPVPAELTRKPLFRVSYDSTGALKDVEPISKRLIPAEWGRTMAGILRAHVRPQISTRRAKVETVWLVSGSAPKIVVHMDLIEKRPALVNGSIISRELDGARRRLEMANPGLSGRVITGNVRMTVTEEGTVAHASLVRPTFDSEVDREILSIARNMIFTPARVEEYPVRVLVEIPITITFAN